MKKIKWFLLLRLFLTGCSSTDKQQYVKSILLYKENDRYTMSLMYYDFTQPEETYSTAIYTDDDIYKLGAKAMADKQYNFRLCETVSMNPDIFTSEINAAVYLINSLRISPCADLLFYTGENDFIPKENKIKSPIYNLSLDNNIVSTNVPLVDENGNQTGTVLINDGEITQLLNYQQHLVLGMVMNSVKNCGFLFRDGSLWADLDDIHTSFYRDGSCLNIVVDMAVKERKGMSNSIETSQLSDRLMIAEITNIIYDLYSDIAVQYNYNLHWFCAQHGKECDEIKVKVNIN